MGSDLPISDWLGAAGQGDADAVQSLWEVYFARLVSVAAGKLRGSSRRVADEEDVALSAFDSFCRGTREGRFPRLADRDDLWKLLVVITARKAADQMTGARRLKRGGGAVRGDSVFGKATLPGQVCGWDEFGGREPTPEFALMLAEEFSRRLESLDDETLRSIALAKLEGETNEQIARRLDTVVRTVERKLRIIRRIWSGESPP